MAMDSQLLRLLAIAERRPCLSKEPILDEVRRIAAQGFWNQLNVPQRAYCVGMVGAPLPEALDWDDMPLEAQLAMSKTVMRWAPAIPGKPKTPSPTPAAPPCDATSHVVSC